MAEKRHRLIYVFIAFLMLMGNACSINKLVVSRTTAMVENGMGAVYEEEDLQVAQTALESHLKLLEVLLRSSPEDKSTKTLLAQGYNAYALGFVEDTDQTRAEYFYLKGRDFALDVLRSNKKFRESLKGPAEDFEKAVNSLGKESIAPLFWCASNWGKWIMLNLDNVQAIFELPKVEMMMRKVLELDETYYFAGAHVFFGSLLAAKPKMLGGKPDEAQKHFESAIRIAGPSFLLTKFYYARFYATGTLNEDLFVSLLSEVLNTPLDALPEYALINHIAQEKARLLMKKSEQLF